MTFPLINWWYLYALGRFEILIAGMQKEKNVHIQLLTFKFQLL